MDDKTEHIIQWYHIEEYLKLHDQSVVSMINLSTQGII